MTQREKAKAYDEALERARKLYNSEETSADVEIACETIFPELAESEDERVKKELLELIGCMHDADPRKERWLAWLEKQGQEKHLSEPIKDYQGSFTCWNNAHDFRPKHLQRCICYDKYMGGVYCYVYDDISKYWCTQTTEEHDSDGDNHISDYADYRITLWMPLPDTSFYPSKSLLDKQGKPKWTEEDSSMQLTLMRDIEQVSFISKEGKDERIMWLNKLDDRFHQNTNDIQKSKWTEEDDKNLESIDIILFEYKDLPKENYWKMINWLKSLKQRMG